MISRQFTRRDFSARMVAIFPLLGSAARALGQPTSTDANNGVSSANEAIHQEVIFKASRKRVYEALTDPKQFHQVVLLSTDGKAMAANVPTEISHDVGGAFSLFGGHILGRHIELVPSERLVQAWRAANWAPGVYSIVKFELSEQGPSTKLVFDHTGFPQGQGQHLSEGWKEHYWEPLAKYLA
ncbi:MAG TPA: SRPBCC domain-containing protein [Candidatus Binatia bacterium]|nr:SRPBCC domain-containing protein [Candidatus Binatia bacterium]